MIRHTVPPLRPMALAALAAFSHLAVALQATTEQVVVSGSATPRAADQVPFAIGVVDRDTDFAGGFGVLAPRLGMGR